MAKGIVRNLLGKIRNLFGGKKPVAPTTSISKARARMLRTESYGHRGIAAGSLKEGEIDLSPENLAKRRLLVKEDAIGFLEGEILFVHSTNVAAAQFFPLENKMMVEFKNGSAYLYSPVSEEEAIEFLHSGSKGSYIWRVFRVRGSKTAHKKNYVKLR